MMMTFQVQPPPPHENMAASLRRIPFSMRSLRCMKSKKMTIRNSNSSYNSNLITDPDSFQVGKLIGSYGFMNITRRGRNCISLQWRRNEFLESGEHITWLKYYSGLQSGIEYSPLGIGSLRVQDVGEGNVKIRLYKGRIAQGPYRGTPVIYKVYPGKQVGGIEADMMAANELNAHIPPKQFKGHLSEHANTSWWVRNKNWGASHLYNSCCVSQSYYVSQKISCITGYLQWLAFRNDGKLTAADYAKYRSEKNLEDSPLGEGRFWNPFNREQTVKRRRLFITKLLHGALFGLAYMHDHDRLHQSLGPASVVLNTITEREAAYLIPRIRDLSFSVDIRYSKLEEDSGSLAEGLWRRAKVAGAFTPMEKRAFRIADDIYEAGLLFAYLAFIPFSEAGIMDSISLKAFGNTFRLDLEATREYCSADDKMSEAVKYFDLGNGAGWELLQAMLNPNFRKRPIAEAVLNHRFMTEAVL